ncbi:MAG: penicillin-binding transpeptidase domain-containing protein [Desulfomicrobium escambiense]|nr:penicillin-binding transpeptidase domain-containing protein [Desulfomicrobium escambiense]
MASLAGLRRQRVPRPRGRLDEPGHPDEPTSPARPSRSSPPRPPGRRGRVGFGEVFDCSAGFIQVGGTTITDHEREDVLSFPQVLIHSSNVGTVQFALRLTQPRAPTTRSRAFGFGTKTGIELPGESPGMVFTPPEDWKKSSLPHYRHRLRGHGHARSRSCRP